LDISWLHAAIAIGIASFGLAVAFLIIWWQLIVQAGDQHLERQLNALQSTYAGFFNTRILDLSTAVKGLAAVPAVAAAFSERGDAREAAFARIEELLAGSVPYAKRVAIVPRGEARVDLDHEVPISYAGLNMIKRALEAPVVGPEMSLSEPGQAAIAAPVVHDGTVLGVVYLVFSTRYFFDPLQSFDLTTGEVLIEQTTEQSGQRYIVMRFGTQGVKTARLSEGLAVPHWKLFFDPAPTVLQPVATGTSLAGPLALSFGILVCGALLAFSRHRRKVDDDIATFGKHATRLLRRKAATLDAYYFPHFHEAAVGISRFGTVKLASDPASDAASAHAADEGDDADKAKDGFLEVNIARDQSKNFGIEVDEEAQAPAFEVDDEIFRAYDIRGIVEQNLGEDVVYWIGRAFAAEALEHGQSRAVVGGDGRLSSAPLKESLACGLNEGGMDVVDIGEVPTPLLYFATHDLNTGTGIMITGSHNPPEYNGLKMVIAGTTLAEDRIQGLKIRIRENNLSEGSGNLETGDMIEPYLDRILEDVAAAQRMKVVVDCGNGVAASVAPRLIEDMGCEVIPLYCTVDGNFPNHHPDPAEPKNLEDLITVVQAENADIGLAFDGDGDRLGVVTDTGDIIWPDKLLMLFAQDVVGRNPGSDIIYDVKCSRHLNTLVSDLGGHPIMWKTGHSHIKAKIKETGALLAGEFSGHICFGERWYGFDDAIYSAARLLEILGTEDRSVSEVFSQFPVTFTTPEIKIHTTESAKFEIMEQLRAGGDFGDGTLTDIDGIRVDYADGWGLIRPSNTSPVLVLRFEADAQEPLDRIANLFRRQLAAIDPALTFGTA